MAYITKGKREQFGPEIISLENRIVEAEIYSIGELNYVLTRLCIAFLNRFPKTNHHNLNKIVGVLECVKLEFYRRLAAPYLERKKKSNGDVYET